MKISLGLSNRSHDNNMLIHNHICFSLACDFVSYHFLCVSIPLMFSC